MIYKIACNRLLVSVLKCRQKALWITCFFCGFLFDMSMAGSQVVEFESFSAESLFNSTGTDWLHSRFNCTMKKFLLILFAVLPCLVQGQNAQTISAQALSDRLSEKSDKIEIVNFWATWCGPCVAELPLFEKLNGEARADVKVTLISVDLELDPNPDKVYRFISRKNIRSQVLLLDEKDPNSWIENIDQQWSGAVPATLVINHRTGKRKFVGTQLHEGDLEKLIEEVKNN
jgi:thiol-disulfide isomerase/thioredoxin